MNENQGSNSKYECVMFLSLMLTLRPLKAFELRIDEIKVSV